VSKTNYTDLVAHDTYKVLTTLKNPWPKGFSRTKKIKFIDMLLEYLEGQQDYEKCEKLNKLREGILNEDLFDRKKDK
jgi:hypothetical protein